MTIVCSPTLLTLDSLITPDNYDLEEDILRDPFSISLWLGYLKRLPQTNFAPDSPKFTTDTVSNILGEASRRNWIYERGLTLCSGSYKLWKQYLDERVERISHLLTTHRDHPSLADARLLEAEFLLINGLYERALQPLFRMPRLWLDYATFLIRQKRITLARRTLDRALKILPFTMHERVWTIYLKLADALGSTRLADAGARIWSRYWRVAADRGSPNTAARHVDYLMRCGFYDEAASLLVELAMREAPRIPSATVKDDNLEGRHEDDTPLAIPGEYWQRLCELIIQHGDSIRKTPIEMVLRAAIERAERLVFEQQDNGAFISYATGIFWNTLATWHIKSGRLMEARSIYEEALRSVPSIRDFALVFDAYTKMEETIIEVNLRQSQASKRGKKKRPKMGKGDIDDDVDAQMAHLELLLQRRSFLLLDVRLKRHPNDISLWMERINLTREFYQQHGRDQTLRTDPRFKADDANMKVDPVHGLYQMALKSINPQQAYGSLAFLWLSFAKSRGGFLEAEKLLRQAVAEDLGSIEEMASLWIGFGEMMAMERGLDAAVDLLGEPLTPKRDRPTLHKNIRLWNYYLDLEEARGHVEAVKAAYERVIELGIVTAQNFINYALFIESTVDQETSFRIYERGIAAFGYPIAYEIWNIYLPKFTAYWQGQGNGRSGIERIRDLYEQALRGCPAHLAKTIFIEYATAEEREGNIRHSLSILNRAVHYVSEDQRPTIYELLLVRTQTHLGSLALRPIYEDALNHLPLGSFFVSLAGRYANLEASLGEVERARTIYIHSCSQLDPSRHPTLWMAWQEFETRMGTEASFRDMLRVKRAVVAKLAATRGMHFVPERGMEPSFIESNK